MKFVFPCAFILLTVSVFAGMGLEPHITDVYVDPVKVAPGDTMLVSAVVGDDYGVSSVTADMGGIEVIELELVEGTSYQGIWQKRWLVHDTEVKDYITTITATNRLGQTTTTEVEWSDPDPPFILFWDSDTVDAPSGWTCISCSSGDPFYEKFIRGNASYGGTGGNLAHTHPVNWVSSTQSNSNARVDRSPSGLATAKIDHTHNSLDSGTTSSESLLPRYRSLKVIAYDNGIPSTIPAGAIAIFNDTLPGDWAAYTPQNGYFLMGNGSVVTGGSNVNHTHSVDITTGPPSAFADPDLSGTVSARTHTHTGSDTTASASHIPQYINVTFANATVDTPLPVGLIGIFNSTPPSGWTSMSGPGGDFADRFVVGSTAYGATGGSTTHSHADKQITTTGPTGPYGGQGSGTNTYQASDSHTHDITVSFDSVNNLPPYIDVIFAYAVDPNPPNFSDAQFNETTVAQSEVVRFNVTVEDATGVDTVIATFMYPNATEVNRTLSKLYGVYYYDWTDTYNGGTYNVTYVWANDTYNNANATTYTDVSFSVVEVIDVTLYGVPIQFLGTAPGSGDVSAQVGSGFPMNVTIESTTNVATNLTLKGDINFTTGTYNFSIGNMSYSNTTSSLTAMTASYPSTPPYADWKNIPAPTTDINRLVYFWISIPKGQEAGSYSATVTVKVEKT